MLWTHISLFGLALVAVSAYRQIPPYSGYYAFTGYPQSLYQQPTYQQLNYQRTTYQQQNYQQPNYQQPYYQQPTYQRPTLERRIDARNVDVYDRYDRVPSERSIPFRSSSQRVQAQEWARVDDDAEPRNGNISIKIGKRRGNPVDLDSVVFPGPTSRRSSFVPEIPKECEGKTICETIPNYPHDHVNILLDKIKDVPNRFNLDVLTPEIAQRRGPGEESIELCEHIEWISYPKAGINMRGKWMFIVNRDDEPLQGFKGEQCVKTNQSCSDIALFPDRYRATCQQKMIERSMWVIDEKGEMVKDSISTPSCCTCLVAIVPPTDRLKRHTP